MKIAAWATAVATIAGVGAQFGWWHAIGAALFVVVLWVTTNVIRNRAWMRERNGHDLTRDKAHHAADAIITTMAAAIGTEAARDLALEASAMLDDMATTDATAAQLMAEARRIARSFPSQLRGRRRSAVPAPDVPVEEASASRMSKRDGYTTWHLVTTTDDVDDIEPLAHRALDAGAEFTLEHDLLGHALIVVLAFDRPLTSLQVHQFVGDHPFVLGYVPVVEADPAPSRRTAQCR